MKVERVIHRVWEEWESIPAKVKEELPMKKCFVGKYQYVYTEGKIRISLIKLNEIGWRHPNWKSYQWEICGGGLTDDVEKFATKKDAEKRIKELIKKNG